MFKSVLTIKKLIFVMENLLFNQKVAFVT
jgi:hypothetical protein